MVTLETDRLLIRNFTPEDWQAFQALILRYQASESARYEEPWPTSTAEIQGITKWFAAGDEYLCVCLKATGELIGLLAIERRKEEAAGVHNLGYIFHPDYHGYGYATEGCRAVMGYLFTQVEAVGIHTGTNPANQPSVQLLTRLGLNQIAPGEFVLSRPEWQALDRLSTQKHAGQ